MKKSNTSLPVVTFLLAILYMPSSHADTATATQHLRIIIPQIALIDTDNTYTPLTLIFDPMTEAGDNFPVATATGLYDVSSNIKRLRLHAKINKDLESDYNLTLQVNATGSAYKKLTVSNKRIATLRQLVKTNKSLNYEASATFANKTIPYGDIDVTVTYTLVEP